MNKDTRENTYPHVNAAWCHCAKCSKHAEWLASFEARLEAASTRLALKS